MFVRGLSNRITSKIKTRPCITIVRSPSTVKPYAIWDPFCYTSEKGGWFHLHSFSAILAGTDLSRANLSEAILQAAHLRGANLDQAILDKADFSGADLTGTKCVMKKSACRSTRHCSLLEQWQEMLTRFQLDPAMSLEDPGDPPIRNGRASSGLRRIWRLTHPIAEETLCVLD